MIDFFDRVFRFPFFLLDQKETKNQERTIASGRPFNPTLLDGHRSDGYLSGSLDSLLSLKI